jgi:hypothetical protein
MNTLTRQPFLKNAVITDNGLDKIINNIKFLYY